MRRRCTCPPVLLRQATSNTPAAARTFRTAEAPLSATVCSMKRQAPARWHWASLPSSSTFRRSSSCSCRCCAAAGSRSTPSLSTGLRPSAPVFWRYVVFLFSLSLLYLDGQYSWCEQGGALVFFDTKRPSDNSCPTCHGSGYALFVIGLMFMIVRFTSVFLLLLNDSFPHAAALVQ